MSDQLSHMIWAARMCEGDPEPDSEVPAGLAHVRSDTGRSMERVGQRHRVELCFTPTYRSWADPIEPHFGPLREFVLNNSNHPNHIVLTRRLQGHLRWRNANALHPDLLAA